MTVHTTNSHDNSVCPYFLFSLRQMARKKRLDRTIIVDLIHVTEYLWAAGRAFHRGGSPELERGVLFFVGRELQ
jgi:hypothetical protein